jgi:hypothetical protein
MWSHIADSSSLLVLMTCPSLSLIFHEDDPSFENLRVITMDLPYSFGLYASSPWFLSEMLTSAAL